MHDEMKTARKPRKAPDLGERRRKRDLTATTGGKNLGINPDVVDMENYVYRFVNDSPARIHAMTKQDDWDIVTNDGGKVKPDATDLGDAVSVVVGANKDGSPLRAYLCRKPRKWYDEDQKQKQTELDAQLQQLRRGRSARGEVQGDYIPATGITIAG